MKLTEEIKDTVEFTKFLLLPLTSQHKASLQSIIQSRVDHYIPKISEATGVSIADVHVKRFFSDYHNDRYHKVLDNLLIEKSLKHDDFEAKLEGYALSAAISVAVPIQRTISMLKYTEMAYHDSSIYLYFGVAMRMNFMNLIKDKTSYDYPIIHELSHHLWEMLKTNKKSGDSGVWSEGFAEYCARDFLPKKNVYEAPERRPGYPLYHKMIQSFIEENGEDKLLEIPNKWREFSKKTKPSYNPFTS